MKRCDESLRTLAPYGGLWLCFRAFWDTLETITRSKRVRSWRRFACVFFFFMRFTPNFSFLAWFFLFKHFGNGPRVEYMSVWQNIHYFTEQLVIHECKLCGSTLLAARGSSCAVEWTWLPWYWGEGWEPSMMAVRYWSMSMSPSWSWPTARSSRYCGFTSRDQDVPSSWLFATDLPSGSCTSSLHWCWHGGWEPSAMAIRYWSTSMFSTWSWPTARPSRYCGFFLVEAELWRSSLRPAPDQTWLPWGWGGRRSS